MPSAPNLDGLPLWLQIFLTLCFGLATIAVAATGYFKKDKLPSVSSTGDPSATVVSASIVDMGALRRLSEVQTQLTGSIDRLENTADNLNRCLDSFSRDMREQTHYTRESIELDREICSRLRELREALEGKRHG